MKKLNRAERRAARHELRGLRKRAARARDQETKRRGVGSPATPIGSAIRLAGAGYNDGDKGGALLDPRSDDAR